MVFLMAFGEGAVFSPRGSSRLGEPFAMIWQGRTTKDWEGWPKGRPVRTWSQDLPAIKSRLDEGVLLSGWIGRGGVLLDHEGTTAVVNVRGVDAAFGPLRNVTPIEGGRLISGRDEEERRRVIFLGDVIATELFGDEDPVGQTLLVAGAPYTVIGVMQHKLAMGLGNESPDTRLAAIPRPTFLVQFGDRPIGVLVVMPPKPDQMDKTITDLRQALGAIYKLIQPTMPPSPCGIGPRTPRR